MPGLAGGLLTTEAGERCGLQTVVSGSTSKRGRRRFHFAVSVAVSWCEKRLCKPPTELQQPNADNIARSNRLQDQQDLQNFHASSDRTIEGIIVGMLSHHDI